MNGADLAAIISAVAFAVLVLALTLTLLRLAKLIDATSAAIRETGDSLIPLLTELTETTKSTNRQLEKIDTITDNVVDATSNLSSLINSLTTTIGGPLVRVGEIVAGVSGFLGKKKKK
jgi:predicted PurR-regulated permease PerM